MFDFTILAAAGAATPAWPYLQCDVREAGWHGSTTLRRQAANGAPRTVTGGKSRAWPMLLSSRQVRA
jgi:hypothetical protein